MPKKPHKRPETPPPPLSKLPEDLLFAILSRLPLETLSDCRFVSKSWLSAIRNPNFALIHSARHHSSCLLIKKPSSIPIRVLNHDRFELLETSPPSYAPALPPLLRHQQIKSIHSCNGLILVIPPRQPYYVWNPITGDSVVIPVFGSYQEYHIAHSSVFGFGYDPVAGLAKVVWVARTRGGAGYLQVYDLRTKVGWNVTDERDIKVKSRAGGQEEVVLVGCLRLLENKVVSNVFLHGALHWIAKPSEEFKGVVSFKLATEEFIHVPLPCGAEEDLMDGRKRGESLLVLDGCLCLSRWVKDYHGEIWMMKEYGVESSWVKKYIIDNTLMDYRLRDPYKVIKSVNNGRTLLMCYSHTLGYYDVGTTSFRSINMDEFWARRGDLEVSHHIRSLISPKYMFSELESAEDS